MPTIFISVVDEAECFEFFPMNEELVSLFFDNLFVFFGLQGIKM